MIDFLKKIYIKQEFEPGFLGLFTHPFYFVQRGLLGNISSLAENIRGKTLDVGCGSMPYQKIYNSSEYIGLEIDSQENRSKKVHIVFMIEIFSLFLMMNLIRS